MSFHFVDYDNKKITNWDYKHRNETTDGTVYYINEVRGLKSFTVSKNNDTKSFSKTEFFVTGELWRFNYYNVPGFALFSAYVLYLALNPYLAS